MGRRHLLSPDALREELERQAERTPDGDTPRGVRAELERELRVLVGGKG